MNTLFPAYRTLVTSPEMLRACQSLTTFAEVLRYLKDWFQASALSDDHFLAQLNQCNRQLLDIPYEQLRGCWLPYRYEKSRGCLHWCLPQGPAVEPFQDDTIGRYRQSILNVILQPKTSLEAVLVQPVDVDLWQPCSFIFHLSRCGSTLLSGCAVQLDSVQILSESPLLTEVLLDDSLDAAQQQRLLPRLVDLQAAPFPDRPQLVIKWNAWDMLRWALIRQTFPQVPCVLLVRNPVEVLASHQKMAGRHMSGDPAMRVFDKVFDTCGMGILAFRIAVLHRLMTAMYEVLQQGPSTDIQLVDYTQLNIHTIIQLLQSWGEDIDAATCARIQQRLQLNAKFPAQAFVADVQQKHSVFDEQQTAQINRHLMPVYQALHQNESLDPRESVGERFDVFL